MSKSSGKVFAIIPARYGSTRFPGKPLVKIGNKTMIRWTYESAGKSSLLDKIIVATDDVRIEEEVRSWGGNVIMTRKDHPTGTDRIIEVVKTLGDEINQSKDIVINIQGDEPGIETELIDGVIQLKKERKDWVITTAAIPFSWEEAQDPNRIKVLFNNEKRALYFSRSVIPYVLKKESHHFRDAILSRQVFYRHAGIYCFNVDFLMKYGNLPESNWEALESLEQLRVLQAGYDIGIFVTEKATLSIDHPDDLEHVVEDFKKRGFL